MFGFGGTTGFGQPAQQQAAPAFGAQPASPFGGAFGQPAQPAASPFGAAPTATPLFGAQSPAPAFGQAAPAAAPTFGASTSTGGFGAAGFGQAAPKPAGFGGFGATTTTTPNPFGAPAATTSAFGGFGAATTSAFGAPAAATAPANPFAAPAASGFGAAPTSAFGAAPAATGFGAPAATTSAPFGATTNLFGAPAAAPSPFGAPAGTQQASGFGGFGAAPAAPGVPTNGTRNVPYSKTKDPDAPAGQPATFLMSFSAIANYQPPNQPISHEELRWEDYQEGVKNQSAGPAPTAAGAFGAPAATGSAFGGFGAATAPAAGGFGAPAAQANPFGAPAAAAPAFGATSAPAFGAAPASQPSLFGASPAPAANPFGAPASTPAFGGFGAAPASQPSVFGSTAAPTTGFGAPAAGAFGASPFGGASSAAAFSFNSSPSTFGAASAPGTSLFGAASTAAASPFGATTGTLGAVASPFGAASSASAFGNASFGAFGATAAKPASPFGAPAATTPFGATAPATAGGGLFGSTTPFSFNTQPATTTPSLFGAAPATGGMSFGTSLFGSQPATAGGLFGAAATAQPAAQPQPPTVAHPAYGNFGSLPSVPEAKVGITTRSIRPGSINSGASKASPLLSLRATPVKYGAAVRARSEQQYNGSAGALVPRGISGTLPSAGGDLLSPQPGGGSAAAALAGGGTGLLPLRQNPHRLFIAAPPPSTEAAGGSSFLSPARPPSANRGGTPDGGLHGDDLGHGHGHADGAAETPAPRHGGTNGYANGYAGGGAASGGRAGGSAAAAGASFQDPPASEAHLPRLGRLVSDGYAFSPNVDELRLLHSQNPANLAAVSNFTVARAGVGQVRWVVPVDVRGLALYDIVSISYGEVLCYPDPATKPPMGSGLNKPAELTLYGVFRKDKETGMQIKDGPRAQAYEKSLRQMCGRMGAKFLSYKLDGGVWKFEVEHFSRYGLMDLDDDDAAGGAADNAAAAEEGVGEAGAGAAAGQRRFGLMEAEGEVYPSPLVGGRGLAGAGLRGFALGGGPAASAAGGRGAAAAALLPEDSGMEPSVGPDDGGRRRGYMAAAEPGGSEASGPRAGPDQDMSEARAQLRFGDDPTGEPEVSGGVVGPAAGGGGGGSVITGSLMLGGAADMVAEAPPPPSATAVPLQHALAGALAHDPVRVRALHDTFFGSGGGGAGPEVTHGFRALQPPPPPPSHLALPAGSYATGGLAAGGLGGTSATAAAAAAAAAGANQAGFEAALRARAAAAAAAGGPPAVTTWRQPAAAITPGAPAAVMARGDALLSAAGGPDVGGGLGGAVGSPISFAISRAVSARPAAATTRPDAAVGAVLPLREIRTAGFMTDAGLAMGRGFRVGWGPGGMLVIPGAAEATSATEIVVTRVRVEGEDAAYGDLSYGPGSGTAGAGGSGSASYENEGLEALRERLRAGLEVHLAASRPALTAAADGDADGQAAAEGADAAADTAEVPYWRLCVDSRELAVLVERHVRVCEQQLQSLLGGDASGSGGRGGDADADSPEAARLRHEIETWRLVEVLFARIDGEVPEPTAAEVAAAAAAALSGAAGATDPMVMSTPPSTPAPAVGGAATPAAGGDVDMDGTAAASGAGTGAATPQPPRTLLAALQRRAQLSSWLQRQARRRVEEDLAAAAGSPAAVVLHLLAAHQLAAAAGAAVAAGDARLAMLIARAGSRSAAKAQLAAQLGIWQRAGLAERIAPERMAAFGLLAGQVLETQRLLSLDWRRLLGLNLWYGTPSTASPMAAVQRYLVDRHVEPAVVPHPAPYHVEGLQPSATGAVAGAGGAAGGTGATDVQWELLQLWSTTPAAATADALATGQLATAAGVAGAAARAREGWLSGGGCSRLLRTAGCSPNPLDHSLPWHLMTALQAAGVLPLPGSAASSRDSSSSGDADDSSSRDQELLGTTLEFISQLQAAGGLCEWALYVASTIPDLPTGPAGPGRARPGPQRSGAVRRRVVCELLAVTAPEWMGDSEREAFLTSRLRIPGALLAEARATWARYARDDGARCAALLEAGAAAAAHDVFAAAVAPALFLAGAWQRLAALIERLEPAAAALPSWAAGGGLYGNFLALFGRQLAGAVAAADAPVPSPSDLLAFAAQVQDAKLALDPRAGGGGGAGGDADGAAAAAASSPAERSRLRRRLVLGQMSARVHAALVSAPLRLPAAGAAAAEGGEWGVRSVGLQSALALHGCLTAELQLGGVAVAVAEAGARVACSS
ncbi:hypothetical protein HYH03_011992 [Edaphochlamys debaryana]|uniref:Peptidase S59 domain-containing protein n=1 Tax=Edaphochlamys debaryana TaxID=47281 RepID=A0A835XSZ4_9CHLO|nr:hypothetical protein HYH03_011992 [Edaphochlamys debaryana]|eukprot:KAG2489541.1 hypothetical protein HYH03_011992 [Edaphochlamys debaryana]